MTSHSYTANDIANFKKEAYHTLDQLYEKREITKKQYEGFSRRRGEVGGEVPPEQSFAGEEWGEERQGGKLPEVEKLSEAADKARIDQ